MAIDIVQKSVRQRPLLGGDQELRDLMNREVVPTVMELRARLNELLGVVFWTPTDVQLGSYTASIGEMVKVDPSSGSGNAVILPDATSAMSGMSIWVKNVTASINNIDVSSGSLIDGAASWALTGSYCSQVFTCDGATWWRLGSFATL